ncbi:unnamed protein product [Miscanthus lutarioriparius]|uniref:Uncharacterized protein n=1 Tax=Miscanthus lutarioriparius TaxID=422564 RepID=A0A811QER4_9POAL|nr:unnamed protein product [Miscanthus lutarioriparius]
MATCMVLFPEGRDESDLSPSKKRLHADAVRVGALQSHDAVVGLAASRKSRRIRPKKVQHMPEQDKIKYYSPATSYDEDTGAFFVFFFPVRRLARHTSRRRTLPGGAPERRSGLLAGVASDSLVTPPTRSSSRDAARVTSSSGRADEQPPVAWSRRAPPRRWAHQQREYPRLQAAMAHLQADALQAGRAPSPAAAHLQASPLPCGGASPWLALFHGEH